MVRVVRLFLFLLLVLGTASRCTEEPGTDEGGGKESCYPDGSLPDWVEVIISDPSEEKGIIKQYRYDGKVVFSVNLCIECADTMTEVFDCDRNLLCQFGGIAGLNTCPDFGLKARLTRVVWEN